MMMITIFQHGKGEGPGIISALFDEAVIEHRTIRIDEGEVPDGTFTEGLIILGGPMSAADTRSHPYFHIEHEIIRNMVASGRPVLGICLGAQLIAAAFGGAVYPASIAERGWHRVFNVRSAEDPMIPKTMTVFQWHSDTFDLPAGARFLVRGEEVPNQMFSIGSAIAVQFHPEVTKEMIDIWTTSLSLEERARILGETPRNLDESNDFCKKLISQFLAPEMNRPKDDCHHQVSSSESPAGMR